MNCTDDQDTIRLLKGGTAHLVAETPSTAELEAMLAAVPRETERRRTRWAVVAAALLVGAVMVWNLDRPERDGPPTEQVQAPTVEETDDPPSPEEEKKEPEIESVTFTFEEAWKAADHLKRTQQFAEAADLYRKIASNCGTDAEIRKHVPRALMQAGECQYRQKLYRKAWETYDLLVTKYGKLDPAVSADAAYYRYRSAAALFAAERNRENEALKHKAREAFLVGFPDHPRAVDLGYYIGADWIATGDSMSAAGKSPEARKSYGKALSYLAMVNTKSVLHEKATVRRGEALYKLGRTDEALVLFRGYLSAEPRKTTDPQRLDNRRTARAVAVYFSALCHREKEEWSRLVAVLADFETKHGTAGDGRHFVASVKVQRVRALLALGREDEAIQEAESLRTGHAKSGAVLLAARLLGRHFFEAGKWRPAATWLELALAEARSPTADDLGLAGLAAEKAGNLERAEARLAAAVAKREAELAAEVDVIRDEGWTDVNLTTYRQAHTRVQQALDR